MNEVNLLPGTSISGNLFLAPMAGYTDFVFRSLCAEFGADLCYTEMVSCEGLARLNKKTAELMKSGSAEKQRGIQLFGVNPDSCFEAAKNAAALNPNIIDFNCGCPVPKVVKTGAGAALMRNLKLLKELVAALKAGTEAAGEKIPISVKIRAGWNAEEINAPETAAAAVEAGAAIIGIHGRTRAQGYSGTANLEIIRNVKKAVSVPVIGSGDLFSPLDIKRMLEETGVDAVMIARGAVGNPQIFTQTKEFLSNGEIRTVFGDAEKLQTARRHLHASVAAFGERRACKEIRKHLCAYSKGIRNGTVLRNRIVHCSTLTEYEEAFSDFFQSEGIESLPIDFHL